VSVQYLVMIVLGGLGSVGGAAIGAAIVSALPLVFQQYADNLPFVSQPGEGGIVAGQAAQFLYGAAVILILMFLPGGLAGVAHLLGHRRRRYPVESTAASPPQPAASPPPGQSG
jgi:branched-chain amino acid transport system permease protein